MQTYFERKLDRWLAARGLALVAINVRHKVEEDGTADRLPDHLPADLYWIASVGGNTDATFNHAVVMRGREFAYDPEGIFKDSSEFVDRIAAVFVLAPLEPHRADQP